MPPFKLLLAPLLTLALLLAVAPPAPATPAVAVGARQANSRSLQAVVLSNHDGDTITVKLDNGKTERVRLLGIDTAEIAQGEWGARARDFTRELTRNQRVTLVFDVQERDRYGRLLAYVYLPDGRFLNLELVKQGYAMVLTYPPNVAHTDEFVRAQQEARAKGLNIWGAQGLRESPKEFRHKGQRAESPRPKRPASEAAPASGAHPVSLNTRSLKYHEPGCRAYQCDHCEVVPLKEAQARGAKPCGLCH